MCTVQSTLAIAALLFESLSIWAALAYSGASYLQCPHHGAKNSTNKYG